MSDNAFINLKVIPLLVSALALCTLACSENGETALVVTPIQPEMALIPGGEFLMGDSSDGDHNPVHKVYIDSFFIDKYEVTNAQYYEFCLQSQEEHRLPEFWGSGYFRSAPYFPNHPVVGVSWADAKAYAEWAGKRLPTEAEWEYAARGGLVGKKYPLGDVLDSTLANYTIGGEVIGLVAVGSYPPNGYGLYDMAGNAVEWTLDYYDGNYYAVSPDTSPQGPEKGKFRVIRGGGWHSGPSCNRVYFRNALPGNFRDYNVGFRCAKDVE